jgi:hypothetical protein
LASHQLGDNKDQQNNKAEKISVDKEAFNDIISVG